MSESTNRKNNLPEFRSIQEEAEFWDVHDSTEFLDGTEKVELEIVRPLIHTFRVETDARTLDRLYALAQKEGLSSSELAIRWIEQRLEQEDPLGGEQPRSHKRAAS